MNSHKVALAVGSFAALWHLVWSVLILLGWAQPLLNFILSMHSLNNPYVVQSFDLGRSLGLIIVAFVVGYIVGTVFVKIWKSIQKA